MVIREGDIVFTEEKAHKGAVLCFCRAKEDHKLYSGGADGMVH